MLLIFEELSFELIRFVDGEGLRRSFGFYLR